MITIKSIFPNFNTLMDKQMVGFKYKCMSLHKDVSVEWRCENCLPGQQQNIIQNTDKSVMLEIISNADMEIDYHCNGVVLWSVIAHIKLHLSIQGKND